MGVFDVYIEQVAAYAHGLRKRGTHVRDFVCREPPGDIPKALPVRVGPGANPGIILRSETFLELGNPLEGSVALVLWTDNPSIVQAGTITLIGPDIPDACGARLPFGQILVLAGAGLTETQHESLLQLQYVADQIEGYMIKSAPDRVWSRVSREAALKGFDFHTLGKALMSIFRSAEPRLESMQVLFITSGKQDVQGLEPIARQVKKISKEILKETWKIRGYDIDCTLDCSSCGDRRVCDDIREVLATVKKPDVAAR